MDTPSRRHYIALRLERARDDLAAAEDDLTHGHLRAAVNRAYYGVFHAAAAALLWQNVERVRHSGLQAAFGEFVVKTAIVEPEFAAIFSRARKLRESQDYDLDALALTPEQAATAVDDARRFIERLERLLREQGALS